MKIILNITILKNKLKCFSDSCDFIIHLFLNQFHTKRKFYFAKFWEDRIANAHYIENKNKSSYKILTNCVKSTWNFNDNTFYKNLIYT